MSLRSVDYGSHSFGRRLNGGNDADVVLDSAVSPFSQLTALVNSNRREVRVTAVNEMKNFNVRFFYDGKSISPKFTCESINFNLKFG
jgi:hypothetical protein